MLEFSANTGFLWPDLPFVARIRAAAAHGFAAVEFHDEAQSAPRADLHAALRETGLPVLSLNVAMRATLGCAATPGAAAQAFDDVDEAAALADDLDARAIHVLSGPGHGQAARAAFVAVLRHALEATDRIILIEPISHLAAPGYFLRSLFQAADILSQINHPRLKILFDCYHIHAEGGDVAALFTAHAARIGHVQIAAAEQRGPPYPGALDYAALLPGFRAAGYTGAFGCEYRPKGATGDSLGWRETL